MTLEEMAERLDRPFRATQLFEAVYRHEVSDIGQITNLPKSMRSDLPIWLDPSLPRIHRTFDSADRTRRYLVALGDGEIAETVYIPDGDRNTICVSSQVGCALACGFCLTGQLGFARHLSTAEIVGQVMLVRRNDITGARFKDHFNIVLMGMGEPLHNYDNVMKALRILHDPAGLNMSMNRITLSTVGLVPQLERLAGEPLLPNIAVSMTGATDEKRDRWMPINRTYPIGDLVAALGKLPLRRRRIMIEYVLIRGETDFDEDAIALGSIAIELGSKVNLIPLNEAPDLAHSRPDRERVLRFQKLLMDRGITTFVRKSRGDDISAACGQLKKKWADQLPEIDFHALDLGAPAPGNP
jgi:23S rRNA (adenine2503-C2)-methyltransferase